MLFQSPIYQSLKPGFILINVQLYNVVKLSINVHYYKVHKLQFLWWKRNENEKKMENQRKVNKEIRE